MTNYKSKQLAVFIVFIIFLLEASKNSITSNYNDTNKNEYSKEAILKLDVTESSDIGIMATDEKDMKYEISNYDLKITDTNDNTLSWNDLENSKSIEVHFSDGTSETYPVSFNKINKIVILL